MLDTIIRFLFGALIWTGYTLGWISFETAVVIFLFNIFVRTEEKS